MPLDAGDMLFSMKLWSWLLLYWVVSLYFLTELVLAEAKPSLITVNAKYSLRQA